MVVESRRSRFILHVRVVVIFVAGICPNDYVMPQQNECVCVCVEFREVNLHLLPRTSSGK